ncbi:MAG TPA: leucyl/phenylalanyl-tRNA--protein transferase [Cryomorphaceae bacterium]|nr:leucyl/phenylalanyl-tRNA--protein transferase [Owenweeksia sp.]MBF98490.1 leucyl/phenylalanyl-tRNA--protein transferase [Owenweeksia sp.]HAD96604.1 leucyl/phenylalanyl-tRNA--protein transferase [Cryomorphaceae bacterium]HCQ15613.1 leucyl/phenylalanyl-tRNA--protein transferase [Cryomorphaceae bacterium]|tara:strand:+ start:981 stop:1643 length:663 start_codon:yes stop_codon:yes gene_type:complete
MPVYQLNDELWFPSPEEYEPHGLVAVEGDLRPARLLLAYRMGIFPWYNEDDPISWFCPARRMVLKPSELRISKSSRNLLNRGLFEVRFDTAFEEVIQNCQQIQRPGQDGTWINDALKASITELHKLGVVHSVECFRDNKLVGGLYGLVIGKVFCGESMFSLESNASKIAFIHLARRLQKLDFELIDCQVHNNYTASLGAYEIERYEYLDIIYRQPEVHDF